MLDVDENVGRASGGVVQYRTLTEGGDVVIVHGGDDLYFPNSVIVLGDLDGDGVR